MMLCVFALVRRRQPAENQLEASSALIWKDQVLERCTAVANNEAVTLHREAASARPALLPGFEQRFVEFHKDLPCREEGGLSANTRRANDDTDLLAFRVRIH